MEKETKTIRICGGCYWSSALTYENLEVCINDIPSHIPPRQQKKYRNKLTKKHRNLECDNFFNKSEIFSMEEQG